MHALHWLGLLERRSLAKLTPCGYVMRMHELDNLLLSKVVSVNYEGQLALEEHPFR